MLSALVKSAQSYQLFANPSDTLSFKQDASTIIHMVAFDSVVNKSGKVVHYPFQRIRNLLSCNHSKTKVYRL